VALTLTETKAAPTVGDIGLFVDIGSESFLLRPQGDAELREITRAALGRAAQIVADGPPTRLVAIVGRMTGRSEHFHARPAVSYRLVLT
jgi:hypothetical protein